MRRLAVGSVVLPPLSAQRADLICDQALLRQDGGRRSVLLLLRRRGPAGSCHLHQTAGEVQREAQALNGVGVLLLRSDRTGERFIIPPLESASLLHSNVQPSPAPHLHQRLLGQLGRLEGDRGRHVDGAGEAVARARRSLEAVQVGARLRVAAGEGARGAE